MKFFKRLFCLHFWIKPDMQNVRGSGVFGLAVEYEWQCKHCGKVKWSRYENVEPEPNYIM